MTTKTFASYSENDLAQFIQTAHDEIFVCLPFIQSSIAEALIAVKNTHSPKTHVLIDFDAQTVRQGYGKLEAVEKLISEGVQVRNLKDIRIAFIIVDQLGYFLFIESRSLLPADKSTINAVQIDALTQVKLKKHFFNHEPSAVAKREVQRILNNEANHLDEVVENLEKESPQVSPITKEAFEEVKQDLAANPPLDPDYKRLVEVYSSRFQYVKLLFTGANIKNKKIDLPTNDLLNSDSKLKEKLETKLNLFDPEQTQTSFSVLEDLKNEVNALRENYLKKIKSRDESLLERSKKEEFIKAIEQVTKKFSSAKDEAVDEISKQIRQTKNLLKAELISSYLENPEQLSLRSTHFSQDELREMAEDKAGRVIYGMKWPAGEELLEKLALKALYSDITIEDLKSENFRKELLEIGMITKQDINAIAEFTTTIGLNTQKS